MKKIVFIVPYIGSWPIWFSAFLKSCETNPTVDWLFFTDCEINIQHPKNVKFIKSSLNKIKQLTQNVNLNVALPNARKICDLRPAFGLVFKDYIKEYDFWGFCDVDIIWGDIRKFMTNDLLGSYDLISSRKGDISGHFTIIKNTPENAILFTHDHTYKSVFNNPTHLRFDEVGFTHIVRELKEKGEVKVYWDKELLERGIESVAHQEYYLDRWLFSKGKIYDLFDNELKEYMYLHFINWKRTMKYNEVEYENTSNNFYISYNKIHYDLHSRFSIQLNKIKNLFNGYYVLLARNKRRAKYRSVLKKIKRRINTKKN